MPSERVREARVHLEWYLRFGGAPDAVGMLDALIAAVRAEVLAEVRERMRRQRYTITLTNTDCGYSATLTQSKDGEWVHLVDALAQLEAT